MHDPWTHTFLDEMREVGDPLADAVVEAIFDGGKVAAVNTLMKTLVRNDGVPAKKLPRVVRDYLDATDDLPPWADQRRIEVGERFFELHGPFCVVALAGAGIRDAQKVRLMHAAVRHLALASDEWDPDWGVPVNQEDLAFTLLTFSIVVLDAIAKLGRTFSAQDADAYFHCWNCVGHVLGIESALIADTIADSRRLWRRITARNWEPCREGADMTEALIGAMEHAIPGTVFDGFPAYLVRHLGGDELADILDVPGRSWTSLLAGPLRLFGRGTDAAGDANPVVAAVAARFSTQLLDGFGWVARGGERAPFDIPQQLADRWGVQPGL
jgi:hypothetical protein